MSGRSNDRAIQADANQREKEEELRKQQYAYGLVERLAFYVISAELIFCGYVLLKAKEFGAITGSGTLYLFAGLAALSGIVWRYFYNERYHEYAHGVVVPLPQFIEKWIKKDTVEPIFFHWSYWIYLLLSLLFFVLLLAIGFVHLISVEVK